MVTDFEIIFVGIYFGIIFWVIYLKRDVMFYNIIDDDDNNIVKENLLNKNYHINMDNNSADVVNPLAVNPLSSPQFAALIIAK